MNCQEFCQTLDYSLKGIGCPAPFSMYEHLFREIDLDRDGWISYSDYFLFLREYFGSSSYAASIENIKVENQTEPEWIDGNNETPEQRIAKLVYSQLKISVMLEDKQKKMLIKRDQADAILKNVFGENGYEKDQIIKNIMQGNSQISYENFMLHLVPYYLCQIVIQRNCPNISRIENGSFTVLFNKFLSFVAVKPADHILMKIFEKADGDRDGFISIQEYTQMIQIIFCNYKFDSRGIPRNFR